jgi:hypothetical protein
MSAAKAGPPPKPQHSFSWHRFRYGCIGALAPEICRLVKVLPVQAQYHPSSLFVLISLAFVVLGGIFASAWEDDKPLKCIYMGSTFPIWISAFTHLGM